MFKILKKILGPKFTKAIRPLGHGIKSYLAAMYFGFPASKLKVIGITGTKGKTTTTILTGRLLNLAGIKTGYISTATLNLGGTKSDEFLNPFKMTSIDGVNLQKYLGEMVKNDCQWVVLEMSSQGLEQNRHWGIQGFDIALFLNIYPEHLEAHGGFEEYKLAKSKLVQNLLENGVFIGNGSSEMQENTEYMWDHRPENRKLSKILIKKNTDYEIGENAVDIYKNLIIQEDSYPTGLLADFEVDNLFYAYKTLVAIAPEKADQVLDKLPKVAGIAGRMEFVVGGLNSQEPINILVDYAHEPESIKQLLMALAKWRTDGIFTQVIHILSSDGVGRDDWKKPIMGDISQKYADITILTTDNYDEADKPEDIVNLLGQNFDIQNEQKTYYKEIDRQKAFHKAIELAREYTQSNKNRVLIVSTGVGSEQGLTQPNGKLDWDERKIWKKVFSEKTEIDIS